MTIDLPINDPADGSTMHGFGWQAPWQIASKAPHAITLRHVYGAADPYAYEAEFSVGLSPTGAKFSLRAVNIGKEPLPFGLGFHPWFPRDSDTMLQLQAAKALRFGPRYRASGIGQVLGEDDYATARRPPGETAVSYVDWSGKATLAYPSRQLFLTIRASETLRHPVLWTPHGASFICLEPQSHAIGAPSEKLVREATPMTMLAPGEAMTGWMMIEPRLEMKPQQTPA